MKWVIVGTFIVCWVLSIALALGLYVGAATAVVLVVGSVVVDVVL